MVLDRGLSNITDLAVIGLYFRFTQNLIKRPCMKSK